MGISKSPVLSLSSSHAWFRFLLLPSAAKRLVELDHSQKLLKTQLCKIELCLKQVPISIKGIKLGVDTAVVTKVSETKAILQRGDEQFLLLAALPNTGARDQGI